MEATFKNRIILILGIATLICLAIAVTSCRKSLQQDTKRKGEILKRMNAEEALSNLGRDKETLQKKFDALNKEMAAERADCVAAKKSLLQEQLVNQSLKEEILKLTKLKEKLEGDLKEALIAVRSPQPQPQPQK